MPKVLIVEDEIEIAEIIRANLEIEGFTTKVANDGLKGLEIAEIEKPDIIILDIMMPRVDGWEVLLKLKSQPQTREIPVIIVSAKGEDISKLTAFRQGVDDYLVKPFSSEELVARTKLALQRRLKTVEERKGKAHKIPVESKGKVFFLNPAEIVFCHSHNFLTDIYLSKQVVTTSLSLTDLELRLRGWPFYRTHRSFLVNLDWVKELIYLPNRTCLLLMEDSDQTQVPVSRRAVRELKRKLGLFA